MNKTFVLSDESVNRHGFIVRNTAINLEQFQKNPVMYYNHNPEKGVIGRWENLRFENGRLVGDPVFDEKDEFAMKIKGKVEDGFISSASIGFNAEREDVNTLSTPPEVLRLDLIEISVCDVPSNKNAIALYGNDRKKVSNLNEYLQFTLNINPKENGMNEFLMKLGEILNIEHPTEENIIGMVKRSRATVLDTIEKQLSEALKAGLVSKESLNYLRDMGKNNPVALSGYLSGLQKKEEDDRKKKVEQYFLTHRKKFELVDPEGRKLMKDFALSNYDLFCAFAEYLPERVTLSGLIENSRSGENKEDRSKWTLSDYRKHDPAALKKNPELYRELLEEFNNNR